MSQPIVSRVDLRPAVATVGSCVVAFGVGAEIVRDPALVRPITAIVFGGMLLFGAMLRPRIAIIALFAFLPFLELGRRMLIGSAGWSSHDPLLLIAPFLALFFLAQLYVIERRGVVADGMSKLVLVFLALVVVQIANPRGGGIVAGAAGAAFVAAPLVWFFIGRELVDSRLLAFLLGMTAVVGLVVALYGLAQTEYGFPSWDSQWLSLAGYVGLNVGGEARAFSTFPSSQEYATYLGVGCVVVTAFAFARRRVWLVLLPLLATAMFLASVRAILVIVIFAVIVLAGLRTGNGLRALVVIGFAAAALIATVHIYKPLIEEKAAATNNPFVTHQVLGVASPLDAQSSTFLLHLNEFKYGIEEGFREPLGQGTAVISLGGARFGAIQQTTEDDISNAFVSCGLLGGLVFLALVVLAIGRAGLIALRTRTPTALAATGVLLVTAGQWLNGGLYTVTPLAWIVIGWVAAEWATSRRGRLAV